MNIQQSFNQMLTTAQHATGLKKYLKGQEAQTQATQEQTQAFKDYAKYQALEEERQVEEAAKEQEYKEKEAESKGYSSPEQQFRWEEEFEAEKRRKVMRGEEALNTLEERINFLSNFKAAKKMRKSILLDKSGKQMEVEYGN